MMMMKMKNPQIQTGKVLATAATVAAMAIKPPNTRKIP
jgi:hypothetical protein